MDESNADQIAIPELEGDEDAEDLVLGDSAKKGTPGIIDPGQDH